MQENTFLMFCWNKKGSAVSESPIVRTNKVVRLAFITTKRDACVEVLCANQKTEVIVIGGVLNTCLQSELHSKSYYRAV